MSLVGPRMHRYSLCTKPLTVEGSLNNVWIVAARALRSVAILLIFTLSFVIWQ